MSVARDYGILAVAEINEFTGTVAVAINRIVAVARSYRDIRRTCDRDYIISCARVNYGIVARVVDSVIAGVTVYRDIFSLIINQMVIAVSPCD